MSLAFQGYYPSWSAGKHPFTILCSDIQSQCVSSYVDFPVKSHVNDWFNQQMWDDSRAWCVSLMIGRLIGFKSGLWYDVVIWSFPKSWGYEIIHFRRISPWTNYPAIGVPHLLKSPPSCSPCATSLPLPGTDCQDAQESNKNRCGSWISWSSPRFFWNGVFSLGKTMS